MDTNTYEIVFTDTAKEELEEIKPHNDVYRKLVIDNYVALYEVEETYKQVVIYRVLYGKRDYLKMED